MTNYTKKETDKFGNTSYYNDKGQLHRLDGPAVEYRDGLKFWWVDGKLHRLDGPAVEDRDGGKDWYIDGKRHRLDGPAVERADGSKFWFVDGKLHRLDGPAVELADGSKHWFVDGKKLTENEFNKHPLVVDKTKKDAKNLKNKMRKTIQSIKNDNKKLAKKAKNLVPSIGQVVKMNRKAIDWSLRNPDFFESPGGGMGEDYYLNIARSMFFNDVIFTVTGYGAMDDDFRRKSGLEVPFVKIDAKLDGQLLSSSYYSVSDIKGYGLKDRELSNKKYFVHYVEGCIPKVFVTNSEIGVSKFLNKWVSKHGSFDDNGDNWIETDRIYMGEKFSLRNFLPKSKTLAKKRHK